MKDRAERIMETVERIYDADDEGLLGFCIRETDDTYYDTGYGVIHMFKEYPEHAELLDMMLIAICGWSIESLENEMEKNRDYFECL